MICDTIITCNFYLLSLFVLKNWQPVQTVPRLSPSDSWDRLPPTPSQNPEQDEGAIEEEWVDLGNMQKRKKERKLKGGKYSKMKLFKQIGSEFANLPPLIQDPLVILITGFPPGISMPL